MAGIDLSTLMPFLAAQDFAAMDCQDGRELPGILTWAQLPQMTVRSSVVRITSLSGVASAFSPGVP